MKKKLIKLSKVLTITIIIIMVFGVAEKNNFLGMKKWGTSKYYIQIKEHGEEYVTKDSDGKEHIVYYYKMNAYNKDGKQIKVEFHSNKKRNLKLNAYLVVSAISEDKKNYNQIQSYQEIPADKVPTKAKEQLDK